MKNRRIITAMNYISDEKIAKADEMPEMKYNRSRKTLFTALGGVFAAAAIGIVILQTGIFSFKPDTFIPDNTLPTEASSGENTHIVVKIDYDSLPFEYAGGKPEKLANLSVYGEGQGDCSDFLSDSGNPWSENMILTEMPVFQSAERGFFRPDDYIPILEKYSAALGEKLTDVSFQYMDNPDIFGPEIAELYKDRTMLLTAKAGNVSFEVDAHSAVGKLNITVSGLDSPDDELAAKIMGFDSPQKLGDGTLYDKSEDIFMRIMNYNFRCAKITSPDTITACDLLTTLDCIGMYPVISVNDAKVQLAERENIADSGLIKHIEFEYLMSENCEFFTPYYEFFVLQPDETYKKFLIPAVSPEYIDDKGENT